MAADSASTGHVVRQRTLKNSINCSGVALHSGAKVSMMLHPAEADTGIVFRRTDAAGGSEVLASWRNAIETPLCTTLVDPKGNQIATIEHLMSALSGCGIDNAVIELNGPEVPIMDGSAAPFVFLIECAGITVQNSPRRALRILEEVSVAEPHRAASLAPGSSFTVGFEIEFSETLIGRQEWFTEVDESSFKRDVARARTFGLAQDIEKMRAMGLARGGSLENAIVVNGHEIVNEEGLRFPNEFVRHKVLDSIGDLYLAGTPIIGHFQGDRAGHALTLRLLQTLFAEEGAWEWTELTTSHGAAGAQTQPDRAVAARA
ncbi:UDP-3-O-acyl-N-acetylglucosamine deacetylase [Pelagibius sp. CAU 1746]|uniref:UDP-3-O-acyl-N-acetylglucosamine deacetylase n=1 Tax=Pelagibius sp. CAU 1746 TaxID=3140370 RepID=UPI00325AD75E